MHPGVEDGREIIEANTLKVRDVPLIRGDSLQADLRSNYAYAVLPEDGLSDLYRNKMFELFGNPSRANPDCLWVARYLPKKLHTPLQYPVSHNIELLQGVGIYIPDRPPCLEKVGVVLAIIVLVFLVIVTV